MLGVAPVPLALHTGNASADAHFPVLLHLLPLDAFSPTAKGTSSSQHSARNLRIILDHPLSLTTLIQLNLIIFQNLLISPHFHSCNRSSTHMLLTIMVSAPTIGPVHRLLTVFVGSVTGRLSGHCGPSMMISLVSSLPSLQLTLPGTHPELLSALWTPTSSGLLLLSSV